MPDKTLKDYYELSSAENGRIAIRHKQNQVFDKKLFADFFNTIIQTKGYKDRLAAGVNVNDQQLYLIALNNENIPVQIVNKVITEQAQELLRSPITLVNDFKLMLQQNTAPQTSRIHLEVNAQEENEQAMLALRFQKQQEENERIAQIPTVSGPPRKPGAPIVVQDHITRSFNWPWERCTYLAYREGIFIIPPSDRTAKALHTVLTDLRTLHKANLDPDRVLTFSLNNRAGVFLHNKVKNPVEALLTLNSWLSSIGIAPVTLNEIFAATYFLQNNLTNAGEFVAQLRALTNPYDPNTFQAFQDNEIISIPNELVEFIDNLRTEEMSTMNNNNNNNHPTHTQPLAANARLANLYKNFQWNTLRYFKFDNGIFICSAALNITPGALDQKLQKLRGEAGDNGVISFKKCINGVFVNRMDKENETINVEARFNDWLKNKNQPNITYEEDYGEMVFQDSWAKLQPIVLTLPPISNNVQANDNNRSGKRQRNPLTFTENNQNISRPNTSVPRQQELDASHKRSKH